mmetsp:Transcript_7756/g.12319  ORF Transcript_7756/g.12319 Transcript_7756/m.12319 type:complete len:100 (+) Transcript_7756:234-533(+)
MVPELLLLKWYLFDSANESTATPIFSSTANVLEPILLKWQLFYASNDGTAAPFFNLDLRKSSSLHEPFQLLRSKKTICPPGACWIQVRLEIDDFIWYAP